MVMTLTEMQAAIHEALAKDMLDRFSGDEPLSAAEWTSILKYLGQAQVNLDPDAALAADEEDNPLAALVEASKAHMATIGLETVN